MFEYAAIVPYLRCPRCREGGLRADADGLFCPSCAGRLPLRDGIVDTLGDSSGQVITPFQRLMQSRAVVSIYEGIWRRAGYYVASSRSFSRELDSVLRLQRGKPCERLLDLACGTSVFTRPLARQCGGLVVGFDLSWPMLRHARHLVRKDGLSNILLMRGTAFRLPFVTGAFEYVNCCGALHLFDSPDAALDEIARVLKPGGHFCAQTTIRPDHSAGMAPFLERRIRFGFFSQEELLEKIRQRGFNILESERHRISYTFVSRYLS